MMISFSMIILGSHLITAVADHVPKFDIERGYRLDSAATRGVDLAQPIKKCVSDEQQARQQLEEQWPQFLARDRASCTADTMSGGTPSYVELLTCLQMANEVRKSQKQ